MMKDHHLETWQFSRYQVCSSGIFVKESDRVFKVRLCVGSVINQVKFRLLGR